MTTLHKAFLVATGMLFSFSTRSQYIQKVSLNSSDSTDYYLAIPPLSGPPRAALVVLCPFGPPESMLAETRLHGVASANAILTVYASIGKRLLPDQATIHWVSDLLSKVSSSWGVDPEAFVLGGSDLAGTIVLRYGELAQEHPEQFIIRPKLVFSNSGYVDLASLYHRCERQIRMNYYSGTVGDAHVYIDLLNKGVGNPETSPEKYRAISPFHEADTTAGNERWLRNLAVRLYYDTDIDFQLKTRRNSYYETDLPDASELIDRLMLAGNKRAEFISAKHPAFHANGQRSPYALSVVDETECIQWIRRELHFFDPNNPMAFVAPYHFQAPEGWPVERSPLPPRWDPEWNLRGIEEIRFAPGWGKAGEHDYWSLAYLFWLDGGQKVDAAAIQSNLRSYFDGLIRSNGTSGQRNIPEDKKVPVRVTIAVAKTEPDDQATYSGTIDMLDYQALRPMQQHFMAHVKECPGLHHTALFVEMSPQPLNDPLWEELKAPKRGFRCGE